MTHLDAIATHIQSIIARLGAQRLPADRGLISGDLSRPVTRVLLALELNDDVAAESQQTQADLLVTLASPAGAGLVGEAGRALRSIVANDIAHIQVGHGKEGIVVEALAKAVDLHNQSPILPYDTNEYAVLIAYTPVDNAEDLRQALAAAGAGAIGDYTGCAWSVTGTGEFTPQQGADPTIGMVGSHEQVEERRLEMVVPLERIAQVTHALRQTHPYEEPAFSFLATHPAPDRAGCGRVGTLDHPMTPQALCHHLKDELGTSQVRYSGEEERVERIAVGANVSLEVVHSAVEAQAQAIVGAGVSQDVLNSARSQGLSVIDVGASACAWAGLVVLSRHLAQEVGGDLDPIVSTIRQPEWTTP